MRLVLWVRDPGARDAITFALSRMGLAWTTVASVEEVLTQPKPYALLLGPTFTLEEARRLCSPGAGLPGGVAWMLLRDVARPLPTAVLACVDPRLELEVPVRLRALREALEEVGLLSPPGSARGDRSRVATPGGGPHRTRHLPEEVDIEHDRGTPDPRTRHTPT